MRDTDRSKPGLALSGGGFRATLFHCGALLRLNELGLLRQIERVGSVSGGSIAAGKLAAEWPSLAFDTQGSAPGLRAAVIDPLRKFCGMNIDRSAIFRGGINPWHTAGDELATLYDKHLFGGLCLHETPDFPQFVFKATNLQTGRMVRFSKKRIADYRIGEIRTPRDVKLSLAVAASSAFPPVLSPVRFKVEPGAWSRFDGADLFGDSRYNSELVLTDGGAYDNIGLESVDSFATVLASDAGAPFAYNQGRSAPWTKQLKRVLDIATDQSRGLRKRLLFAEFSASERKFAYWGIDQNLSENNLPGALPVSLAKIAELASVRTRLDRFNAKEQGELTNWGYAACDNALRRFILPEAAPPSDWPEPNYPLDSGRA